MLKAEPILTAAGFDDVWPILALAMFNPDSRARQQWRDKYVSAGYRLWGFWEGDLIRGVVGVRNKAPALYEITHIAVTSDCQRQGLGRAIWEFLQRDKPGVNWVVETDDASVGFYVRLGFSVDVLAERYSVIRRYRGKFSSVTEPQ